MIRGRRRTIALTVLALAAPLPAFALTGGATPSGPATLSVSSSLRSCGVLETQVVCELSVSFDALDNASSYTASVTRADGSVIDAGAVSPGGSTLYVPYVGSGTYTVRVTAYGIPEGAEPTAKPKKIATAVARTGASQQTKPDRDNDSADADATELDSSAGQRSAPRTPDGSSDLENSEQSAGTGDCADPAPAADPASEQLPEEPPEDLDPENPDEDADGIPDEDEQAAYDRAVAEQQRAATQAAAAPGAC